jgi:hypothetical protein
MKAKLLLNEIGFTEAPTIFIVRETIIILKWLKRWMWLKERS